MIGHTNLTNQTNAAHLDRVLATDWVTDRYVQRLVALRVVNWLWAVPCNNYCGNAKCSITARVE